MLKITRIAVVGQLIETISHLLGVKTMDWHFTQLFGCH